MDTVGSAIIRAKVMFPRLSVFAALAASFLLSGCFFSETPKFPVASAAAAFGDGGRFQGYDRTDDGGYKKADEAIITVKRRGDGGYDFVNEKDEVQPISFHPIAGGNFVGQAIEDGKSRYAYVIFRIAGNEAFIYVPDCDRQDKAQLEKLGVTIGKFECGIDRVADPAAFFASLTLGEPASKLVRE
jgi:hypothetical protein